MLTFLDRPDISGSGQDSEMGDKGKQSKINLHAVLPNKPGGTTELDKKRTLSVLKGIV